MCHFLARQCSCDRSLKFLLLITDQRSASETSFNFTIFYNFIFSFTHVIPYWKGQKIKQAIMRIDVGGKLLTNYLKELVSYRQLNLMDEYLVCHKMKELGCYCTLDFKELFEKRQIINLGLENADQNRLSQSPRKIRIQGLLGYFKNLR